MKTSMLKILAAASLLLIGCGGTTSDSTELQSVLNDTADREGVPAGECRDECVAAALVVFDACTEKSDDREQCFGEAIHAFFECARECKEPEPPTCEEGCELAATVVLEECLDGLEADDDEAECLALAREALAKCIADECKEPEPPTCEEGCELAATVVLEECLDGLEADDDEAECVALAQEALAECIADECKEPEPPTCEEGCELAATVVLEECLDGLEADDDEAECLALAREALAKCIADECKEPEPPTCEDRCGAIATHAYDACTSKIDSEERCEKIARAIQWLCNKHCEGYKCPCHGDDHCHDEDSDSGKDKDKECNGDGNGHFKDRGNGHGQGRHCYD